MQSFCNPTVYKLWKGSKKRERTKGSARKSSTSQRGPETASHPHGTAHCQDVCVAVWALLTHGGGGGVKGGKTQATEGEERGMKYKEKGKG